jgi:hypothetical protein
MLKLGIKTNHFDRRFSTRPFFISQAHAGH